MKSCMQECMVKHIHTTNTTQAKACDYRGICGCVKDGNQHNGNQWDAAMKRKLLLTTIIALPLLTVIGSLVWLVTLPAQEKQVAAFTTGLRGRTHSQIHNVQLAIADLDGQVILAGKVFSFNKAVGPWTLDKGYVKAPVSFSGDKMLDWGGGVCQASTAVYNTALLAGLPIIERNRHHWPATYVPPGQDAAVAYPNIDLRFRNTLKAPLRISAKTEGDAILIRFYSRATPPRVHLERQMLALTPPTVLIRSRKGGNRHASLRGQPGFQVALYRSFLGDHPRRELVSRDTYPPQNRIVWR
jgi:vancomycin resistance protein VanW